MILTYRVYRSGLSFGSDQSSGGPGFRGQIDLDKSILTPSTAINGKVIIVTDTRITCRGIRVQLNATVDLNIVSPMRLTTSKTEGLIQGTSDSKVRKVGDYICSPIRTELLKDNNVADWKSVIPWSRNSRKRNTITIPPGTHSYPFTLVMPVEPLPAPFKNQYGRLEYKIAAYMDRKSDSTAGSPRFTQIATSFLVFSGYNNLSHHSPLIMEPQIIEKFFLDAAITCDLTLEKGGFLKGEKINFELRLSNPCGFVVSSIFVKLVRRIDYYNTGRDRVRTDEILDMTMINDCGNDENIYHIGNLLVPEDCIPSYNVKTVYSVTHFIQYDITVAENPNPIKGNTEIIIGTTKEPCPIDEDIIISRRMSSLSIGRDYRELRRSESIGSRLSDSSIGASFSRPPAYSQLSSRAMSMISIETLPPHYDDIK